METSTETFDNENQRDSLALEIACGRSIRRWAVRNGVDVALAYERAMTQDFRRLIDTARLRVADRLVGKMLRGVNVAIAQLIKLCTRSQSESIRLAASRTLLQHWIKVWEVVYYEGMGMKFLELEAEKRGGTLPGKWRPCSPWGPMPGK